METCHSSDSVVAYWIAYYPHVAVNKPEHIKRILNSPNAQKKSYVSDFFSLPYGLTLSDISHKMHRKQLLPAFSTQNINK